MEGELTEIISKLTISEQTEKLQAVDEGGVA
jgi:hypothetical protein